MRNLLTLCVWLFAAAAVTACSPANPDRPDQDAGEDTTDLSDLSDLSDTADADADADVEVHVPIVDNSLTDLAWADMVQLTADRDHLSAAFAAAGYTPPPGAYVFAGRAGFGLEQLNFTYFSRAADGFTYSAGVYWPASTVKLLAAVGAIHKLATVGCTSAATVSFTDDDGSYYGSVSNLIDLAIRVSDNVSYNRLMEIGGFEEINGDLLSAGRGMPSTVLQRRYTHPTPESNLRHSPEISYSQGGNTGTLPAREGTSLFPECPDEANCITLAELTEGVRRVALHEELPASERFTLTAADLSVLHTALLSAPSQFQAGISAALAGHVLRVYNKTGTVYGDDRLDHAVVVDDTTGEIYLLAASMPYNTTTEADLAELARQTILAMTAAPAPRVYLQRNAGAPVLVRTQYLGPGCNEGSVLINLQIELVGDDPELAIADRVELFMDRWPLEEPLFDGHVFRMQRDFSSAGDRLLTVYAYSGDTLVAVRHAAVHVGL